MRVAVLSTAVGILGFFGGLMTYEVVVLLGITVSMLLGLFNLRKIGRAAKDIKELQEGQGARIDSLSPPPLED